MFHNCMYNIGLKAQNYIAQGCALGTYGMVISPCKGKSV